MITERETTNEQVAEALGFTRREDIGRGWWLYPDGTLSNNVPDFKHLNATFKYVVPEMDPCEVGCIVTHVLSFGKDKSPEAIATELCKAFMKSKEKSCQTE